MPKIKTRQDNADEMAINVRKAFERTSYWNYGWPNLTPPAPPAKDTYASLIALGYYPNPDAVDRVMGRDGKATWWDCDACGEKVEEVLFFDINCGESNACICRSCCRRYADDWR